MELPEAWRAEPAKMRSSYDLLIGALRLCGVPEMKAAPKQRQAWGIQSLQFLGGMPFTAPSPAGFGDTLADWSGPEAMLRRVEWAQNAARVLPVPKEVTGLAEAAMGPIMQPATREAIAAAGSPRAQLALLLACPEFQRR